jgi:diguanylate cyclase (GGDEF)-like protein/PAS domain S-box-containing protein
MLPQTSTAAAQVTPTAPDGSLLAPTGSAIQATAQTAPVPTDSATSAIAFEHISDVMFHLKVTGEDQYRFVYVNPAFYRATMLQACQVIGKSVHEVIPAMSLPTVLDAYRSAVQTGRTQRWEEVSDYPAGRKAGQVTVTPVFDHEGRCTDLVGTVHDVSLLAAREDQLRATQRNLEASLAEQQALAQALRTSEKRLDLALNSAREGVWDWNVANNTVFYSEQWKTIVGLPPDWTTKGRSDWNERIHPEDRAAVLAQVDLCRQALAPSVPEMFYTCEYRLRHASGEWIWIRSRGSVVERSSTGDAVRMSGTIANITETVRLRKQVEAGQAFLLTLTQQLPGAVFNLRMDARGVLNCDYVSDQMQDLFGLSPQQIMADWTELVYRITPEDRTRLYRGLKRSGLVLSPFRFEFRVELPHHGLRWREVNATPTRTSEGQVVWCGFVNDISERKHSEGTISEFTEVLKRRAHYDSLTGLPNRTLFRDRLEEGIRQAGAAGGSLALLFVDLDRFKEVNDLLGHDAGDRLLAEAARRIERCVGPGDTVARLGGDEFTVILTDAHELEHVEQTAQQILDVLSTVFTLKSEGAYVAGSIGIALYPRDGVSPDELMRNADHAMYRSKSVGRNRMTFFDESMQSNAMQRLMLIADLRRAVPENQLSLYFQPIVSLLDGAVVKAEALVRWQRPGMGLTLPEQFIAAAEDSGIIHELGDWVFTEATSVATRWSALLGGDFQISINRSPVQFQPTAQGLDWVAYLDEHDINPACISIEITEGLLLNLSNSAQIQLDQFSAAGIEVAVDDFGTGYSSMSYLKRLDIDYLKIDRSFVAGLGIDATSTTITETIIVMAHKLGLKVIAEGVESPLQRDWLKEHECDFAQGFLFSLPLPVADFEACLMGETAWAG